MDCRQPESESPFADEGGTFGMEAHRPVDGFAAWRDSVSTRKDKVKRSGDRWTLDTTAVDDLVKEAWLVVRASDFHPLEQHIRFADDRQLDFEELAFELRTPQIPDTETVAPARVAPNSPTKTPEVAS